MLQSIFFFHIIDQKCLELINKSHEKQNVELKVQLRYSHFLINTFDKLQNINLPADTRKSKLNIMN